MLYVNAVRKDVSRFVKDAEALKIWSLDYFHEVAACRFLPDKDQRKRGKNGEM